MSCTAKLTIFITEIFIMRGLKFFSGQEIMVGIVMTKHKWF